MKTLKKQGYIASMLILVTWLMTGISVDDEFYEEYIEIYKAYSQLFSFFC